MNISRGSAKQKFLPRIFFLTLVCFAEPLLNPYLCWQEGSRSNRYVEPLSQSRR